MYNKIPVDFEEGQLMTKEEHAEFMEKNKGHGWISSQQEDGSYKVYSTVIESFREFEGRKGFDHIWYPLCNLWDTIRRIPRNFKWRVQRVKRGWSEADAWNGYNHLSEVILGIVEWVKHNKQGHPASLGSLAEWEKVLDKISFTFIMAPKLGHEILYVPSKDYDKKVKKLKCLEYSHLNIISKRDSERYEEGWELFQRYFNSLWD